MAVTVPPQPAPIDKAYKPKVSIAKLRATDPIEDILAIIDRDGGVILEDFATAAELEAVDQDVEAYKRDHPEQPNTGIPILPKETYSVPGLVGQSDTAAQFCEHPVLEQLRTAILQERFIARREGVEEQNVIDPLLSISITLHIRYGAPRQLLHRDDNIHGIRHPVPLEKASQFGCLIAGCKTRRENGATMFVPGSHRWDDEREPRLDELCFAGKTSHNPGLSCNALYHVQVLM